MVTVVPAGYEASSAHQTAKNIGHDGAVQIGHVHHVELVRIRHGLHAGVVDNHVVVLQFGIVLVHTVGNLQEETIGQLHDVGLVNGGNLLAIVLAGELKGVAGHTLGILDGHHFHALHNSGHRLMFQHGVLAIGVLADEHHVNVVMAGRNARIRLAVHHIDVQIQLVTDGHVAGDFGQGLGLGLDVALECHSVPLNRCDGIVQIIVALGGGIDVDHLEIDGCTAIPEDLAHIAHQFRTNAAARQHGDGMTTSVLCRGNIGALFTKIYTDAITSIGGELQRLHSP